jgi:hypothetical protein
MKTAMIESGASQRPRPVTGLVLTTNTAITTEMTASTGSTASL